MINNVIQKIKNRMIQVDSMAGVGIDPVLARLPRFILDHYNEVEAIKEFGRKIIDYTHDLVIDYKVNANFFMTGQSRLALEFIFAYLKHNYPEVVRICDGKFADVGHTAKEMADYIFGRLDADAVLLNPYLGFDAVQPFIEYRNKVVVLCINTSNPSAVEIQDAKIGEKHLWRYVFDIAMNKWNKNNNIIPVLSATHIDNLRGIRNIIDDLPIVLAGVGIQGGDLYSALRFVLDSDGYGAMISASRSIIYPENADKNSDNYWLAVRGQAKKLRDYIRKTKKELENVREI